MRIAVAGATGYVGGRLVPRLLGEGHEVRCLVRNSKKLAERPWAHAVEIVAADALRPEDLAGALEGVNVAYYLIHSMESTPSFVARDRRAAAIRAFSDADGEQVLGLGTGQ